MDRRLQGLSRNVTSVGSVIDWPLPGLLLACLHQLQMPDEMAALAARLQACRSYASCHRLSASLLLAVSWLGRRALAAHQDCCSLVAELLAAALGRERVAVQELHAQPEGSQSLGLHLCCRCDE
jgi:hypothetical protein